VLVSEGFDAELLAALRDAASDEGAMLEVIAPAVGGVTGSDGAKVAGDERIDGGPSVLYDAVVVLASDDGVGALAEHPAARDFVTDAHAHNKFIGHSAAASALFEATGLTALMDDGYVELGAGGAAPGFVERCRALRYWARGAFELLPAS
jgi:catalase